MMFREVSIHFAGAACEAVAFYRATGPLDRRQLHLIYCAVAPANRLPTSRK